MRVMLTGGTGFVGGHTVGALLAEGHEPHLLVRDTEKLKRLCEVHGLDPAAVPFTLGDITDEGSVRAALEGCQACIHAAAVASFARADRATMVSANTIGARIVLDAAAAAGCDPVVHVSSMGVILPPVGDQMSAADPVVAGGGPYPASKAEADLYARGMQADGRPVVIVYPGGVLGPRGVGLNAGESLVAGLRKARVDIRPPRGGLLVVDVRDLATALARMVNRRGARRYVAGGNFVTWDELAADLRSVTRIRRPLVDVTEEEMVARFGPDTADYSMGLKPADDGPLLRDTGVTWRPFQRPSPISLGGWRHAPPEVVLGIDTYFGALDRRRVDLLADLDALAEAVGRQRVAHGPPLHQGLDEAGSRGDRGILDPDVDLSSARGCDDGCDVGDGSVLGGGAPQPLRRRRP